jgi:hypothetical protein
VDVAEIVEAMSQRIEAASQAMFTTASDAKFANLSTVNVMMLNVLCGTVRNVFERDMSELLVDGGLRTQLTLMFCTYLDAAKFPPSEA